MLILRSTRGGMAQLVARLVRNEKARGSNPLTSTEESRIRKDPALVHSPRKVTPFGRCP